MAWTKEFLTPVLFCDNPTGLESMGYVQEHYDNSSWYKARFNLLTIRNIERPDGSIVHSMQYVRK